MVFLHDNIKYFSEMIVESFSRIGYLTHEVNVKRSDMTAASNSLYLRPEARAGPRAVCMLGVI